MHAFPRWLTVTFATAILAMLGGSAWLYHRQHQQLQADVEQDLEAVAQLKVNQIVQWRNERLADASMFSESPFLLEEVSKWMEKPTAAETEKLFVRFRVTQKHQHYRNVVLLDPGGRVRLSLSGWHGPFHEAASSALVTALREHQPVLTDLHAGPGDLSPHMDVIAPLFVKSDGRTRPCGAIILECDARDFLYPMLESWPVHSSTAETLLVRREGDSVLYLNDLRHQTGAAIKLRIPLSRTEMPAVVAVMGKQKVFYGKDYRGVPVLAILKRIPDSPWFMVAKVDVAEAFAAWRFRSELILSLTFAFVVGAVVVTGWAWQRKARISRYTRNLIEVSLDPLVTISNDGKITDVNEASVQATGVPREKLIGTVFSNYFTEPEKAHEGYHRVFTEGCVRDYPLAIRNVSGRVTDVLYNASVYRDDKGHVLGVFAAARDVTARKRAEAAVEAERQRFNNVLEILPVYVVLLTPDYHVPFANRFFRERFGEAHGRRCFEYLFGRNEPCEICETYKVLETRSPREWEWTGPDHHIYHIFDFPFTDTDGASLIMEVGIDITDRKNAEKEIRKLNTELEQRVLERTAELTAVNQELEAFTYSVSHDLRAPLRHLTGYAELLRKNEESSLNEEGLRHLGIIFESARRMGDLIDDLLDFSRTGRVEMQKLTVDMEELTKGVLRELHADMKERTIRWDIGRLPSVCADPSLMRVVLTNLLANAVKFTRPRTVAEIRVDSREDAGETIFFVRDNGVGFDMKYTKKLFGVFQRLHSLDQFEGTGIGLANVRRVIQRHGGRTWAEGVVNAGASFYFSLPKSTERKIP